MEKPHRESLNQVIAINNATVSGFNATVDNRSNIHKPNRKTSFWVSNWTITFFGGIILILAEFILKRFLDIGW